MAMPTPIFMLLLTLAAQGESSAAHEGLEALQPDFQHSPPGPPPRDLAEVTETWRKSREAELKSDQGWLAVSGLVWLKDGETTVGSGDGNTVVVADGPARFGVIFRAGPKIELRPEGGVGRALTTDDPPFQIGRTQAQLIKRGDLIGLRLRDAQNARMLAFRGLEWYEVNPRYRVLGQLVPSAQLTTVKIANVLGQVNDFISPGIVHFELNGKKLELTPVYETLEKNELFYIFRDSTAVKTTYGAGRFLYGPVPDKDGIVVLDFNRAYSPPCAFTDFATCPLPPPQNRLKVAIEAGEKDPHRAH